MSSINENPAMQRILGLFDENSFLELGSRVTARSTDFNLSASKAPSDGVITGQGLIDGNLVFVYSQDTSVLNGTIGEMHARKITAVYDKALKLGAPVVGFIDCGGVRLQESVDSLDGFGQIYAKMVEASGVIPQICCVFGDCGGGLSALPALSDFTFIEEKKGRMFVNTPDAIPGNRTEKCDTASADFQSRENGCVDMIGSAEELLESVRLLVSLLPENCEADTYTGECEDDLNRACESMENMKDDPRYLLSQISDNNLLFETKAAYARNMVTGFIKLNGMTVGAVANCAKAYDADGKLAEEFDGTLTARGCNKAAEFVNFCDAFSIPVLSITNVTGLHACMCSERNLAKALARLTVAFVNATVPKVNLITGKAFGSAYMFMNSKSIGADVVYAWKDAEIGTMDAKLAAEILYPEAKGDELETKAGEFRKLQLNVESAAARGQVDRIIEPSDSRKFVVAAMELLYTKASSTPVKKHGTK